MEVASYGDSLKFCDIHIYAFQYLPSSQVPYQNQIALVVKFILLMPATYAISERSASGLHRIRIYLHTSVLQYKWLCIYISI